MAGREGTDGAAQAPKAARFSGGSFGVHRAGGNWPARVDVPGQGTGWPRAVARNIGSGRFIPAKSRPNPGHVRMTATDPPRRRFAHHPSVACANASDRAKAFCDSGPLNVFLRQLLKPCSAPG